MKGESMVKLTDMYQAAYLVCNGCRPIYMWANEQVVFGFDGTLARQLADDYICGEANCSAPRFAQAHKEIRAKIRDMKNQRKGE